MSANFHPTREFAGSVTARIKAGDLVAPRAPQRYGYESQSTRYSELTRELVHPDFTPMVVTLPEPILIWQTKPHVQLDVLVESELVDFGSFARIQIVDTAATTQNRAFVFYYLWVNPSQAYAVVNVASVMILTGKCVLSANKGFFSGDHTHLDAAASLVLWRNGGWGADPQTGVSLDQSIYPGYASTLYVPIADLDANGGGIFGDFGSAEQNFPGTSFELSFPQMVVPGGASVLFMVTLTINTSVSDFEISNEVDADFATGGNRIISPGLTLEILTPVADS
ncbi:MAG: hypothetical protein EPN48_09540 [Microbacteriaceae bacterium]|nr:MAG: hypothetical protein EPN48_09540 [Microbacteriaceae bacterium]